MQQSIAHVALVVRDYDEAIAFYVGLLGFRTSCSCKLTISGATIAAMSRPAWSSLAHQARSLTARSRFSRTSMAIAGISCSTTSRPGKPSSPHAIVPTRATAHALRQRADHPRRDPRAKGADRPRLLTGKRLVSKSYLFLKPSSLPLVADALDASSVAPIDADEVLASL